MQFAFSDIFDSFETNKHKFNFGRNRVALENWVESEIKPIELKTLEAILEPDGCLFVRDYNEIPFFDKKHAPPVFLPLTPVGESTPVLHFTMLDIRHEIYFDSIMLSRERLHSRFGFDLPPRYTTCATRDINFPTQEPQWATCGLWAAYNFYSIISPNSIPKITGIDMFECTFSLFEIIQTL